MKHENTRALYAYWNDLRAGRPAPYRSELDPRAIAALLESTFILEHGQAAAPRFRLAGTRLCDQFGMELRGMSALSLWHGEGRAEMRDLLKNVVTQPGVGYAACTVETRAGYLFEAEFLFLPLYSDLGVMNRILGCGHYMSGRDAAFGAQEPVHHWVDAVTLAPVGDAPPGAPERGGDADRAETPGAPAPGDAPLFSRNPYAGRVSIDGFSRRRTDQDPGARPRAPARNDAASKIAEIAAGARARRTRESRRALLYAIDGGVQDKSAVARHAADQEKDRGPTPDRPPHLRLVGGDEPQTD